MLREDYGIKNIMEEYMVENKPEYSHKHKEGSVFLKLIRFKKFSITRGSWKGVVRNKPPPSSKNFRIIRIS